MWQRYTHLYVEMKRFCEGQNTCVAIFKDSQLNLVAVSKWGLTEEMRVIKKLWDYCSESLPRTTVEFVQVTPLRKSQES